MHRKSITPFLLIVLLGYVLIHFFQEGINRTIGEYHQTEEVLLLPSGQVVKKLSMGFESLMADMYWIRAIQYFGGGRMTDPTRKFDLLAPLLEITTTLDPAMVPVYQFGAVFLSEPSPMGAGDPHAAIALLQKGISLNPGNPDLYLSLGFIYYWQLKDYKQAARVFLEGAEYQKGKLWLRNLAAFTMARGGDRVTSRYLWGQIYETAENQHAKNNALAHLMELETEDQIEALEKMTVRFRDRFGRYPHNFAELAVYGYLRGIPLDPSGVPYLLDPESGKVFVSANTKLVIVPK